VSLDPHPRPSLYADLDSNIAIVRERASSVCVRESKLLCVRLRDPTTRVLRLFVPGGAIEPNETAEQAAIRETHEETGYTVVRAGTDLRIARYPFVWNGQTFAVTTHFVPVRLLDPCATASEVHDASYHEGVIWLALADVPAAFAFQQDMLAAVQSLLAAR
jgi:8-oxo-dGTP pyrophosphatase MutT (NUDIX family)